MSKTKILSIVLASVISFGCCACDSAAGKDPATSESESVSTTLASSVSTTTATIAGSETTASTLMSVSSMTTVTSQTDPIKPSTTTAAVQGGSEANLGLKYNYNEKAADGTYIKAGKSGWVLDWSDEFNGTRLNTSIWQKDKSWNQMITSTIDPTVVYKAESSFDAITLDGAGHAVLRATKDGTNLTNAQMISRAKYDRIYGYYEVRLKMPKSEGIGGFVYMMPRNASNCTDDPADGMEMDIAESPYWRKDGIEGVSHTGEGLVGAISQGAAWGGYGKGTKMHTAGTGGYHPNPGGSSGFYDEFHVYAIEWRKDVISYYVDGQLTWATNCNGEGVTQVEEYFIIACGFTTWAGAIENAETSADLVIDYVRVFRNANA